VYEEAIEQLQAEQDALGAENAKLRKRQGVERQGNASSSLLGSAAEGFGAGAGGLEVKQLAEQVSDRG